MLNLTEENKEIIKKIANENPKEEICGLIIEDFDNPLIQSLYSCRNVHDQKAGGCIIRGRDYLAATELGKIVGIYHSHINTDDQFSPFMDKMTSFNHHLPLVLYVLHQNEFKIFDPDDKDNLTHRYIGRDFLWGKNDCFSLVIDFYKNELGIIIHDVYPNRGDDYAIIEPNYVKKLYEKNSDIFDKYDYYDGFKLKRGDILVFFDPSKSRHKLHCALYLGNNQILHQLIFCKSSIDYLVKDSIKHLKFVFRCRKLEKWISD